MQSNKDVTPQYTRDGRSPLPKVSLELYPRMADDRFGNPYHLVGEPVMWMGRVHRCMIRTPMYYLTFTLMRDGQGKYGVRHCVIPGPFPRWYANGLDQPPVYATNRRYVVTENERGHFFVIVTGDGIKYEEVFADVKELPVGSCQSDLVYC